MKTRTVTGLVLVAAAVYLVGWAPPWLYFLAVLVAVEWALVEYFAISRCAGFQSVPLTGYVAGGLICLVHAVGGWQTAAWLLTTFMLAVMGVLSLALLRARDLKDYLGVASSTISGVMYVGLTLPWLIPLRFFDPVVGRQLVFLLLLVVCCSDTFAYLGGRALGRTPLFPRVSPKKTVEGSLIGLGAALLAAGLYAHWVWPALALWKVLCLAGCMAVAGQVGDLVESALKRGANVKDSGNLLPGHGGLLDRIDGLLFAIPVAWLSVWVTEMWLK